MASVFPPQQSVEHTPRECTDVVLGDESAPLIQALSSDTAQSILGRLREEPGTASDVAGDVDTSLQNTQYHLERLCEVGLVEPVDTWYSTKGREMTVYALSAQRLVIEFDDDSAR